MLIILQGVVGTLMFVGIIFGIVVGLTESGTAKPDLLPYQQAKKNRRRPRDDSGAFIDGFITDEALHQLDDMFK